MEFLEIKIEKHSIPVLCLPGRPKALLDQTVAQLYHINTKYVKRAVMRNKEKFPDDFCFQLTEEEFAMVRKDSRFDLKYSYHLPYAFTHLGANMLANVLRSEVAIQRSLQIVRAFTAFEKGEFPQQINAELRAHLKGIYQMIKVLVDEIYLNRDKQREMMQMISKLEARLEKIDSALGFSKTFLADQNLIFPRQDQDVISPAQARQLKSKVAQKSRSKSETMRIWSAFKATFDVTRYVHLPRSRFEEALQWIDRYSEG